MTSFAVDSSERRRAFRFAIRHQSRLRLTLEGNPDGEEINSVMLTDISQQGLMAAGAGHLVPGAQILLEVPLVGWREVEVIWIAENRAGCRFIEPLSFDELRLAAASSERLALECPSLGAEIAQLPAFSEASEEDADNADADDIWSSKPWLLPAGLLVLALLAAAAFMLTY
nr:PilZ domain-containing protein [Sphingomonas sp. Y57]